MKALILFAICATTIVAAPQKDEKVLVLGTVRGTFTDIEDRIFREEIMRQIANRGFPIVAIMDLEREITDNNIKIRDLKSEQKKYLAKNLGARWIVYGTFPKDTAPVYRFFVMDAATGIELQKEIQLDKKTPVQSHWQSIAEMVADMACAIITSSSAK